MNETKPSKLGKGRLLKRIARLGRGIPANVSVISSSKRKILLTTRTDNDLNINSYSFEDMESIITTSGFFPGYIQTNVNTISCMVFHLSLDESILFHQYFNNISFYTFDSRNAKQKMFVIPLDEDIFNQETLDQLLLAINSQLNTKISISFIDTFFKEVFVPSSIQKNESESFLCVSKVIKRYENQLKQKKALKNQRKTKQLVKGLYTVKRFISEAEASNSASLKNGFLIEYPKQLQAPFTLNQARMYADQLDVSYFLAIALGINKKCLSEVYNGQFSSQKFKCLLVQGDEAVIYINKNLESNFHGRLTYKSISTGERLSMAELYAKLIFSNEYVNKPTLMAIQLKLLDEVGLVDTNDIKIDTPKNLTDKQLLVFDGFKQLMKLKQSVRGQEKDAILFTYTFASSWCGVSRITATGAIKKFVSTNLIYIEEQVDHMIHYLFTKVKTLKDTVKEVVNQTKDIKAFISKKIKSDYLDSKGYKVKEKKKDKSDIKYILNKDLYLEKIRI